MSHVPLASDLLSLLRTHGQRLDLEIAEETGVAIGDVRKHFATLLASGEVIACKLTRFEKGKRIDATMYRASGYFPPAGPGRKPKPAER
jgi:hypothetical protein